MNRASEIGIRARQASCRIWSKRKRGRLQRTHMNTKMISIVFVKNTRARIMQAISEVVTSGLALLGLPKKLGQILSSQGMCHPPKNSATQTAEVVIIPAYSARKNSAKRMELYSV